MKTESLVVMAKNAGTPSCELEVVTELIERPRRPEALLEIEATPIQLSDIYSLYGKADLFQAADNYTPGMGGIARVIETGADANKFEIGQRVYLPFGVCGKGAWRQKISVHEADLVGVPEGDALQLCMAPSNGLTAFALLNCVTELNAGDWIIQNAANSNVGRFLIALARLRGIKTINIVRRSDVFDDLKSLGADAVLKEGPDLSQRVRQQVGLDAKIMLGIDSIAGTSCQEIIDCVSDSATVIVYGLLSGLPLRIFAETLFMRDIRIRGFFTHFATRSLKKHEKEEALRYIFGLINKGVLNSKIAGTYSLDEIDAAVHHAGLDGTARNGKVILVPNL